MLSDSPRRSLSEFDQRIFAKLVPPDHYLRTVLALIHWDDFHQELAAYYCADQGRPAESPVLMLKLEYLRYHHNLSDRQVIDRAQTDLAFRYFLQLPLEGKLPDPSSLCVFRGRLGVQGYRQVFQKIVQLAREQGVVKDRLRIKDATHVIADIAVPSTLVLIAQARDRLLAAAEPFAPLMVAGERVNLEVLREATKALGLEERLVTRVAQLREILAWADQLVPPEDAQTNRAWQHLVAHRDLAHKILADQERPGSGDRTISTTDPEARCGKHGQWFHGYLLNVLVDADSELITSVDVLPATGDEAVNAVTLIRQEEAAHGNDVQALSLDGVGFNGPVLHQLEAPQGLNVDTYVPPPRAPAGGLFTLQDFQEDSARGVLICPAGHTSQYHFRDAQKQTTNYRFDAEHCRVCPLLTCCMKGQPARHGRTVRKSDYQAEHDRVRQKATTPQYAAVRREHLKVERKLHEAVNHHGGRRARFRGREKVLIQQLMACLAVNVKRLVRLFTAPAAEMSLQT